MYPTVASPWILAHGSYGVLKNQGQPRTVYSYIASLEEEFGKLGLVMKTEEIPAGVFNLRTPPSFLDRCFQDPLPLLEMSTKESECQFKFETLYHTYYENPEKILENQELMNEVFDGKVASMWGGEPCIVIGYVHGKGSYSQDIKSSWLCSFNNTILYNSGDVIGMSIGLIRKQKTGWCSSRFVIDKFTPMSDPQQCASLAQI